MSLRNRSRYASHQDSLVICSFEPNKTHSGEFIAENAGEIWAGEGMVVP